MPRKLLDFTGIGAQKCATTWIHRILEDHPQACVPSEKEVNFFTDHYDLGYQWYERLFERAPGALVAGEISPSYFHDADAPARAAAYNPRFRLLVTLRDPVERAFSNHLHNIRVGAFRGDDLSFERGLDDNPAYVEQSRYFKHLERWLGFFDLSSFLVVLAEDILADPAAEARRVYAFLGVDPDHRSRFLYRRANPALGYRSGTLERALKGAGACARKVLGEEAVRRVREHPWFDGLRARNRFPLAEAVPPMAEATRLRLMDTFAEDVLAIARLLGRRSLPWKTWEHAAAAAARPHAMA
jgi:hypothetical protein